MYSYISLYSHRSTLDPGECSLSFQCSIPWGGSGCLACPRKVPHGAHCALLQEERHGDGQADRQQPGVQRSVLHHGSEPGHCLHRPGAPVQRAHLQGEGGVQTRRMPCSVIMHSGPSRGSRDKTGTDPRDTRGRTITSRNRSMSQRYNMIRLTLSSTRPPRHHAQPHAQPHAQF